MAIWKVIAAGLFALLIAVPAQAQCITMDIFVETIRPANPALMIAKKEAQQKALGQLNRNRAASGHQPVNATLLLIGVIQNKDGTYHVAVAMFAGDGCAVEEALVILTIEQWAGFAVDAGITADDFVVLQDS